MESKTSGVYILGVDIGTQSLKLGIYDTLGNLVVQEGASYATFYNQEGFAEQNGFDWWDALHVALKKSSKKIDLISIKGLALCATSSTVVLTDNHYQPVAPAQCWMDQRSVKEEDEINGNNSGVVKNYLQYSGQKTSIEWMTTKSLWLKRHYDLKGKYILEQIDWMNYMLTGEVAASKCNASCKWNYVEGLGGFSEEFFTEIGLEGITNHWPKTVLNVGDKVGEITESASEYLGLKQGTPVFQGGIDAHIGMIGSKALEPGNLNMITGTSFVHLIHLDHPIFNDSLWGPYDSPLIENHWLLEGGQLSSGSIISWFIKEFYPDKTDLSSVYDELEENIKTIDPGSEGLIVLDSWKGNRTPYKNPYASGAFIGLTLAHSKYHIYRAILESIAFGTKNVIETFKHSSIHVEKIIAGGGGTNNSSWIQIISDVTGLPIYIPKDKETGSKGAAIIAAYGIGAYPTVKLASNHMVNMEKIYYPDPNKTAKYDSIFESYLELNQLLFPIMKKLKAGKEETYELCT
jgi:ribulose kinase